MIRRIGRGGSDQEFNSLMESLWTLRQATLCHGLVEMRMPFLAWLMQQHVRSKHLKLFQCMNTRKYWMHIEMICVASLSMQWIS